jgi:hypothetical protein
MTIDSLRSVTLATIENYRDAANQTARAYRLGGRRLVSAVHTGFEKGLEGRAAKLVPQVASSVLTLQGRVSDAVCKGIDEVTHRAEAAVDMGADGAAKQVGKVADLVAGVGNPMVANGLQAAARLSLPGAKVALAVSGKLADGAKALSVAAQGEKPAKVVKKAAATAKRSVKRAAKPAVAPVADMLSDVAAKAGKRVTRAKRVAAKVVADVAAEAKAEAKAAPRKAAKAVRAPAAKPRAARAKAQVA